MCLYNGHTIFVMNSMQKSQLSQRFLTPVGDVALKEREQFVSQLEECHEKASHAPLAPCLAGISVSCSVQISGLERLVQSLEDEKDDLLTEVVHA